MIGVRGQYIASFDIGDMKDFLKEEQLISFKCIEDTSNVIPIFQLDMKIWDEKILQYINEGKELIVKMGKTENEIISTPYKIVKSVPVKDGEHKYLVHLVGIFSEMKYLTENKILITDKISSVDAMRSVLSQHPKFTFSTNFSTNDKMHWIQPNITNRKFVSHLWNHMYIPDAFPALGTTITGEFRLRDIKKMAAEDPKFKFLIKKKENKAPNEIIYELPYEYSASSTINNQIYAFGSKKLVANLEAGDFTLLTQEAVTPTYAMSSKSMVNPEISPRYDEHSYQSIDNVHSNFWRAKIQNFVNLFTFATVKISVSYHLDFHRIHVLDLVYFKEEKIQTHNKEASETITGRYVVTKVCRMIENRTFRTLVEMCRETPNEIKINADPQPSSVLHGLIR